MASSEQRPSALGRHLTNAASCRLTRLMGIGPLVSCHTHDSFDFTVRRTRVLANPMVTGRRNWREPRAVMRRCV